MIQQDTVKLLRECDAGVKMGVASIEDVLPHVQSEKLSHCLTKCKTQHEELGDEIRQKLDDCYDNGKNPNPIVKAMSWVKTNTKLTFDDSDSTVADLMTDGCNMGVKSLNRYLNQYKAADEYSKDITKRLIKLEQQLTMDMQRYL